MASPRQELRQLKEIESQKNNVAIKNLKELAKRRRSRNIQGPLKVDSSNRIVSMSNYDELKTANKSPYLFNRNDLSTTISKIENDSYSKFLVNLHRK